MGAARAKELLAKFAKKLSAMEDGTGRDNYLNKVAFIMGRYVGADLIAEEEVKAALREAALASGMLVQKVDEKLRRVVDDGKRKPITAEDLVLPEYEARPDGTYWRKPVKDGHVTVKLANFSARIVEDVKLDDGSGETQRVFALEGSLGRAQVPAKTYNNMQWVRDAWGLRANITPGQNHAQHLANAITTLSDDAREVTVYTHLGWREINGRWVYLHAGDGVGAEVRLEGKLARYTLPPVTDIRAAVCASLKLLDLAPAQLAYPLWGAVYRAPLGEWAPATAALYLHGPTGVRKTAVALLPQAHFAPGLDEPAANWEGTANALERIAFQAKDAVLLVDDYVLKEGATVQDRARLYHTAERLIRGNANRGGRARLTADLRSRPEWYSRTLLVITGEDLPAGHSLRARMLMVAVGASDVNLEVLTELQGQRSLLAEATAGYVAWLAGQDKATFGRRQNELRAVAVSELKGAHARTAENVAVFQLGVETALRFAVEVGAIDRDEADERRAVSWSALVALAREQAQLLHSQNPAERFISLVGSLLSSGRAHVAHVGGYAPDNAEAMGWRAVARDEDAQEIGAGRVAASVGSKTSCCTSSRRPPTPKRSPWPPPSTARWPC